MAKGEIVHNEQFLLWPQCFQLFLKIKLYLIEIFLRFLSLCFQSSVADLLYVGKGYICVVIWINLLSLSHTDAF